MKVKYKILLLGVSLTILLTFVTGILSFTIYRRRTYEDMFRAIDGSMVDLEKALYSDDRIYSILEVKNYLLNIYESDPSATEGLQGQELLEKCQDIYNALYLPVIGLGGSQLSFLLKNDYLTIAGLIDNAVITPGVENAFIACEIDDNRLFFLIDSTYGLDANIKNKTLLPGSIYNITTNDYEYTHPSSKYNEYLLNKRTYKILKLYAEIEDDEDGEKAQEEYVATLFVEYNLDIAEKSINNFLRAELINLAIATVVMIVLFDLIVHFMFTRNVTKLNDGAIAFTKNMNNNASLKVIDPKIKSKDELGALGRSLVQLEEGIIDYAEKVKSDAKERERIEAELSIASKIQMEDLPATDFEVGNIGLCASITPAKEVGGDFYDYFFIDDTHLAVVIADVTGKGVPAALFMMKAKGLIKTRLQAYKDLKKAVYEVNDELFENNKSWMFVTVFIGVIDTVSGRVECVSAGHEKPYLMDGNKVEKIELPSNFVLGAARNSSFETFEFDVKGKRLFLFTDGLNEAINSENEEFGYERIVKSLSEAKGLSRAQTIEKVKDDLKNFVSSDEAFDDVTLAVVDFGTNEKFSFKFTNPDFSIIETVTENFNQAFSFLPFEKIAKIDVIFDEILNNIVSYEQRDGLAISVDAVYNDGEMKITFSSNGAEFNPLLKEEKCIKENGERTTIGGFGITLVKNFADSISYERKNGNNVLTVILSFK